VQYAKTDDLPKPVHSGLNFAVKTVSVIAVLSIATFAFAAPTVTILSPKSSSNSGSPVFYEAYATSSSCASGISAMRIYTASGVSAYTANGAHIETFITLAAGNYSTVVEAWDNCGGVGKTTVDITVNSKAGVSVFLPESSSENIPVHIAASAQNPGCSAGISAIRIYTANNIAPYTIDSNQVNTFMNLLPGKYDLTVQAWDNCGHVYKAPLTETAVGADDGYLYAVNTNNVAQFNVSSGTLKNPNGSSNPPVFAAAKLGLSIAVDPGGWFAWVFTTNGIYGYQINQSTGKLGAMPGSPFPLSGTPISEPSGFLYPEPNALAVDPNGNFVFAVYNVSNTVVAYRINRSTGALTEAGSATGSGGVFGVATDFTGQYVYAINQNEETVAIWGFQVDQNNGALAAVPGSPYAISNASYGGGLTSTMLTSGSPASPVLYAAIDGGPPGEWAGYAVNYGTGALTALTGSPFYADGTGYPIVADNHGKWVVALGGFPSTPPENFFEYASIGSEGTLSTIQMDAISSEYNLDSMTEDGSGQFLYTSGTYCPTNDCGAESYSGVFSWTVGTDGLTLLSGPLNTDDGGVFSVGVALKHGD
jgi:hypothetical protein